MQLSFGFVATDTMRDLTSHRQERYPLSYRPPGAPRSRIRVLCLGLSDARGWSKWFIGDIRDAPQGLEEASWHVTLSFKLKIPVTLPETSFTKGN